MKIYFPVLFLLLASCASVPSDYVYPAVDVDESFLHELRCRALLVSYNVEPNDSTQLRGR